MHNAKIIEQFRHERVTLLTRYEKIFTSLEKTEQDNATPNVKMQFWFQALTTPNPLEEPGVLVTASVEYADTEQLLLTRWVQLWHHDVSTGHYHARFIVTSEGFRILSNVLIDYAVERSLTQDIYAFFHKGRVKAVSDLRIASQTTSDVLQRLQIPN